MERALYKIGQEEEREEEDEKEWQQRRTRLFPNMKKCELNKCSDRSINFKLPAFYV